MKSCSICKSDFDPEALESEPAAEMGAFIGETVLRDSEELCPKCLASRGQLAMMYMRDMD